MIEIAGAVEGVRAAIELTKGALASRDDAKLQQALIAVNAKLLDLTVTSLALAQQNQALAADLAEAKNTTRQMQAKADERDRYTLAEVRPGAHAYVSKPVKGREDDTPHFLCQACFDSGTKSLLIADSDFHSTPVYWRCPSNPGHAFDSSLPG